MDRGLRAGGSVSLVSVEGEGGGVGVTNVQGS